jgi:hypothetical protein
MDRAPGAHGAWETILRRARVDREFRRRLLAEPHQAIEEACGIVIPPTCRIKFIERDQTVDALIVLPDVRRDPDADGDDLDRIGGGTPAAPIARDAMIDELLVAGR